VPSIISGEIEMMRDNTGLHLKAGARIE